MVRWTGDAVDDLGVYCIAKGTAIRASSDLDRAAYVTPSPKARCPVRKRNRGLAKLVVSTRGRILGKGGLIHYGEQADLLEPQDV